MAEGQAAARLGHARRCSRYGVAALTRASACGSSGQDSRRGTFSHRHAVLHDRIARSGTPAPTSRSSTCATIRPVVRDLRQPALRVRRCRLRVRLLDLATRARLVIWEAQFGDFANGAQVDHRPVHRGRRGQVGTHLRARAAAAARLRRAGARALAARGSSASCSSAAEDNMQVCVSDHAGADLPPAAPADAAPRSASRSS